MFMLSSVFSMLKVYMILGFSVHFSYSTIYAPIDSIDLESYMGRWYQVYKDISDMSFQKLGTCAVADYHILDTNNISVVNSQTNKNGVVDQISGYAFYESGHTGGELTVDLIGTPTNASYWVIELGPIVNNEYQYSIVSDKNKLTLFVLARNVDEYYELYDNTVQRMLKTYGFTRDVNKPLAMKQIGCDYSLYNENIFTTNALSECQVADYLKKSGFDESSIPTMVCISFYESSFTCGATNKNTDGSTDYGLFQINSYYWCSGDSTSKYNECGTTCQSLFDCQKNTNCAYRVWKEQGFNAWYGYQYHKSECDNYKINC